jgi:hypothetical protein
VAEDVTVGVGALLTFTVVVLEVAEQPLLSITVTEYDPEDVTVMSCVVALVDHVFPEVDDEDKTTLPPVQKDVAPFAVITGVAGNAFTVITIETRGLSSPLAFF